MSAQPHTYGCPIEDRVPVPNPRNSRTQIVGNWINPVKIDRGGPNVDRISADGVKVMGDGREISGGVASWPACNWVAS